jgi:hypothetical protein
MGGANLCQRKSGESWSLGTWITYFNGEMFGATVVGVGEVLAGCCDGPTPFNLSGVSRDHK